MMTDLAVTCRLETGIKPYLEVFVLTYFPFFVFSLTVLTFNSATVA